MDMTSMYPSTRKQRFSFTMARFAWKSPYSSRLLLYISLSGELMYFAIFFSFERMRPPKPTMRPLTVKIGKITRARYLSMRRLSASATKLSPVLTRFSCVNPFCRAAFESSSRCSRLYPSRKRRMMSSRSPRPRRYAIPTAMPSGCSWSVFSKCSHAQSFSTNRLSRTLAAAFSSSVSSRSLTSMPYFLPSHLMASEKESCSISMMKCTGSPPLPHPKHLQRCFAGDTTKLGVFSLWNGHKPL